MEHEGSLRRTRQTNLVHNLPPHVDKVDFNNLFPLMCRCSLSYLEPCVHTFNQLMIRVIMNTQLLEWNIIKK